MDVEKRLIELIDASGVRLIETSELHRRFNACWHQPSQTVYVRWGLDPVTRRCAIAHELGHAHYGDECSSPGAERRADRWAASKLLDADAVFRAARDCDGAASLVAAELGVTPRLLEAWMELYRAGRWEVSRVGDVQFFG